MTQNHEQPGVTLAQQMFGPQAGVYAESKVHIRDDSLDSVQRLTAPGFLKGTTPYRWAVDIGTGAGFTAFAMAEVSERVVASDITQPMLRQARRISGERGLGNLSAGPERRRVPAFRRRQPGPDNLPRRRPSFPRLRGSSERGPPHPALRRLAGDSRQHSTGG